MSHPERCLIPALLVLLQTLAATASAGHPPSPDSADTPGPDGVTIGYGDKGFELATANGDYRLQIQSRFQFRYATPYDTDPITLSDFDKEAQNIFRVNRARLKVGGNAFAPWVKYFWEYELAASNLLDFRLMLEPSPYLRLKVGQWKAHFNRERVISSGQQQMADRSLINRPFTIDRQQGVSLYGRIALGGAADFSYWLSVLMGAGRGARTNDDNHLMYLARLQWNFLGRELGFQGSDTKSREQAAGLVALAAVTNRSPYTRFSQDGGGQLDGFAPGSAGQYRVQQALVETALMVRGFSWQHESHWKEVRDHASGAVTTLAGNYIQLGYFFATILEWVPPELEVAFRHALYTPDLRQEENLEHEYSLAVNWFFSDHRNKLTAEFGFFDFQRTIEEQKDGGRFRLQWDTSL